jgi:hypothetical protein
MGSLVSIRFFGVFSFDEVVPGDCVEEAFALVFLRDLHVLEPVRTINAYLSLCITSEEHRRDRIVEAYDRFGDMNFLSVGIKVEPLFLWL